MESQERFFQNPKIDNEKYLTNPLVEAYRLIHKKEPENLNEWEIAQAIIEVLDNPAWVPDDLAKECIHRIVQEVSYPNNEARRDIVSFAEEKARTIFPELFKIDEVHMDQVDYVYRKWKESQK